MLKVIILASKTTLNIDFIEKISNATNQQTRVEEADRRSNDKIQIAIEKAIFDKFGYFYERKKGEFFNGIDRKYIDKSLVVNRYDFLKSYLAWQGDAANARRSGTEVMFKEKRFKEIMKNYADVKKMFFAYKLFINIEALEKTEHKFGASLKYGKMAIVAAIGAQGINNEDINVDNIDELAKRKLKKVASVWNNFIDYVTKKSENSSYVLENVLDQDVYYKGRTVNSDIKSFFKKQ